MKIYTSRILKCLNHVLNHTGTDNCKNLLVGLLSNMTARLMWLKAVAGHILGTLVIYSLYKAFF